MDYKDEQTEIWYSDGDLVFDEYSKRFVKLITVEQPKHRFAGKPSHPFVVHTDDYLRDDYKGPYYCKNLIVGKNHGNIDFELFMVDNPHLFV